MEWDYRSDKPIKAGFYPVLFCFDPEEGLFDCGAYWDGNNWDRPRVIGFGIKCKNKQDAERLAEKHNPEK